jgi:hypothetical protein
MSFPLRLLKNGQKPPGERLLLINKTGPHAEQQTTPSWQVLSSLVHALARTVLLMSKDLGEKMDTISEKLPTMLSGVLR